MQTAKQTGFRSWYSSRSFSLRVLSDSQVFRDMSSGSADSSTGYLKARPRHLYENQTYMQWSRRFDLRTLEESPISSSVGARGGQSSQTLVQTRSQARENRHVFSGLPILHELGRPLPDPPVHPGSDREVPVIDVQPFAGAPSNPTWLHRGRASEGRAKAAHSLLGQRVGRDLVSAGGGIVEMAVRGPSAGSRS